MEPEVYIVATIILLTGLVGGLAAYLARPAEDPGGRRTLARFLLLGVVAAACVPLFLSLLKSDVVRNIFTSLAADGKTALPPAYESYLIFIGLCLIAAFSSRRFIESVSNQVLERRLDEVNAKANSAAATAEAAREVAQEAVEEVEAADNMGDSLPDDLAAKVAIGPSANERAAAPLSETERKILQAMTQKTYRTRTGIAEDSGVSRNRISELLESLADRKLALPAKSPRTGGARWILTSRGRAALDS